MELKTNGVGGEGTARQPGPFDRALALFDPLLRRAALVVEGHDARWPRQISHDEPDARIKLAGVTLDLGYDTPRLSPALRLIAKAGELAAQLMRRSLPGRKAHRSTSPS